MTRTREGIRRPDGSLELPNGDIRMPDGTVKHTAGGFTYPDGSVKLPSGAVITKEEADAKTAKDSKDTRPALKKDIHRANKIMLEAVANVLKSERRVTEYDLKDIRDQFKDISGLEALRGGARIVMAENARAISTACQDPLNRKAIILDGEPPDWLQELFT